MVTIRPERPEDIPRIRLVNERAFGQPGEAALVDDIRARGGWRISLVAVDGGVNEQTIAAIVAAGATWLVAGSAIYNDRETVRAAVARLRSAIAAG